jgi:predicted nucleic acid-binding protein
MIVLDTSFIIDYFRGVKATYDIINDDDDIATTTISYHEILTGLLRYYHLILNLRKNRAIY